MPSLVLTRRLVVMLSIVAMSLLPACGSDDGGTPTEPTTPQGVSGQVTKGPVVASTVTLHAITASGTPGAVVGGPWTTDANGSWSGEIAAGSRGPYMLVAAGGSYVDEASGADVQIGDFQLWGYSGSGSGQVTPYTHSMALAARKRVEGGATPAAAWAAILQSFEDAFGFDASSTAPSLDGPTASRTYQALLGGISELLDDNPELSDLEGAAIIRLVLAAAEDLSDGKLDGINADGNPIAVPVGTGSTFWPALDPLGIDELIDAINDYAAATNGLGGIILESVDWDLDDPPVGSGSGSVVFSGPGAALLPQTTFVPIAFSRNQGALAWGTANANQFSAQVGVGLSPTNANEAVAVTVTVQTGDSAYGWSFFDFDVKRDVPGVVVNGTTVSFTNVLLPAISGTELPLTVNGELRE